QKKWSDLKTHLLALDPKGNQLTATVSLFGLSQGDQTLDAYFKACSNLFGRLNPAMAKEEQLRWYLRGLSPAYGQHLAEVNLKGTLVEAHAFLLTKMVQTSTPVVAAVDLDAVYHQGNSSRQQGSSSRPQGSSIKQQG